MKVLALIATLAFVVSAHAFTGEAPMDLRVGTVDINCAFRTAGNPTLGGVGPGPGTADVAHDAYTAPTWASDPPSVFSIEQYSFPVSQTYIDHRVCVKNNNQLGGPTSFGFAWNDCGNGVIHPPRPATLGTNVDGNTVALTLPNDGNWYITIGISGFSTGTWDWMWFCRYDGVTPIVVYPPGQIGMDTGGGNYNTFAMYSDDELRAGIGGQTWGVAADRPWCFRVY
jgi:hypothetical protein